MKRKLQLDLFDLCTLGAIFCLIIDAFTTNTYPSNHPELYYWGGKTLLMGDDFFWALPCLVVFPILLLISFFFRKRNNCWNVLRYVLLVGLIIGPPVIFMATFSLDGMDLAGALAPLFCTIVSVPVNMIDPASGFDAAKNCGVDTVVKITNEPGFSGHFIIAAIFLSVGGAFLNLCMNAKKFW